MTIALNQLGQISLSVDDTDVAERFYSEVLGLRKLYRFGDLVFFDCAGVRLFIEKSSQRPLPKSSVLYFRTPDLTTVVPALKQRGVVFQGAPHRLAQMEDHDLWMAFFQDPAGNQLALMQEAPRGHEPRASLGPDPASGVPAP
jgi:methylmalonyl-CoA/ethylmalonyl-CoA epimerase